MQKKEKCCSVEQKSYMGLVKGIMGASIVTLVAFFVLAFMLTYTNIQEGIIAASSMLITACSAIIAGIFTAKSQKKRGLIWGILSGVMYVLIVLIVLFLSQKELVFSSGKLTGVICAAAGGGIGGILGINTKK